MQKYRKKLILQNLLEEINTKKAMHLLQRTAFK